MNVLFSNDTDIEKVASFAALGNDRPKIRTKYIARISLAAAMIVLILLASPADGWIKGLLSGILICGVIILAVIMTSKGRKKSTGSTAELGFITTGECDRYHYDFFNDKISITGKEKIEVPISEIRTIRDIGSAYQLRASDRNYTLKKNGFTDGGAKKFTELMKTNGICIK